MPVDKTEIAPKSKAQLILDRLLKQLIDDGGSDLHLSVGVRPSYRLHGKIVPIEITKDPMQPTQTRRFAQVILANVDGRGQERWENFEVEKEADVSYVLRDDEGRTVARFRVNIHFDRGNVGLVMRVIPVEIPAFASLGVPDVVSKFSKEPKGIVLVTGPTGSGKSTTLAALIDLINRNQEDKIITLEDPIEFVHESKKSMIMQREVGADTGSFAEGLRRALRQDPDIILVGEMRDPVTARIALQAAETGHLVFGTLHTSSARSTVSRVVSMFDPEEHAHVRTMLAASLRGIVCQTLLPKRSGGRCVATEVLVVNDAIRGMIREGRDEQIDSGIILTSSLGAHSLDSSLTKLVSEGDIGVEEALNATLDREGLKEMLEKAGISVGHYSQDSESLYD